MTVRLTPTMSDSTPPPQVPSPPQLSDRTVTDAAGDEPASPASEASPPDPSSPDPSNGSTGAEVPPPDHEGAVDSSPATDSRIALRDARRQRRRTAWLCAAILAVCLGLTIVVVSLARTRPAPSPGAAATSAFASDFAVPSTHAPGSPTLPSQPSPGAPAPEGGNP